MSRLVSRAENWERVYTSFQNINFATFDYDSVKQSIIEYIKLYFPESFNDWIESDELVSIIETFAYIAELISYRIDVAAHENFISTAQRKDSILRLAKLVSYSADRPLPARGLVKITSVTTTETIYDILGNNLSNRTIIWNDITNTNWKDQFTLIMNRILSQPFGTVDPRDRFQIQDVLFELYSLNSLPLPNGVFKYAATVNGKAIPMELVPIEYDPVLGIVERRPQNEASFSLVYAQDGLGDASETTGFMCFTKQGTLQKIQQQFDGVTKNINYDVNIDNVNNIDVWLNNVDPTTGNVLDIPSFTPYRRDSSQGKSGEWIQVDTARAQNVIFNTNPKRNKYEIETRDNNRVRLLFGDGEFADIPSGLFDVWVRTSLDEDIIISQSSVVDKTLQFGYIDSYGKNQVCTMTFSLINSLNNNSASETLEHIRLSAPSVYYAQDRMVNGNDYNTFMLQDSSILKLRTVNRTFVGESMYANWHDASNTYENVKLFGDDGILYYEKIPVKQTTGVVTVPDLLISYIVPLLSSTDIFLNVTGNGVDPAEYNRTLSDIEYQRIAVVLSQPSTIANISLYYNKSTFEWYAIGYKDDPEELFANYYRDFITYPIIQIEQLGGMTQYGVKYDIVRKVNRLVLGSPTTKFWNINQSSVVDYMTFDTSYDTVSILQANSNHSRNNLMNSTWDFRVVSQITDITSKNVGLPELSKLQVLPKDTNGDGIPDDVHTDNFQGLYNDIDTTSGLANIINPKIKLTITPEVKAIFKYPIKLPIYYITGVVDDVQVYLNGTDRFTRWNHGSSIYETISDIYITDHIIIGTADLEISDEIFVVVKDYVYFTKQGEQDWVVKSSSLESMIEYSKQMSLDSTVDTLPLSQQYLNFVTSDSDCDNCVKWKRYPGRSGLNFAWFHYTPNYHLVDPSSTNIMDTFIIQKGYFMEFKRWLENPQVNKPQEPTSLDMRLAYNYLLDNRMISDTIVLHPGKFKLLFGSRADVTLQAVFKVIKTPTSLLTNNQVKTAIVTTVRNFFNPTVWEFGETFYFSELSAAIHATLPNDISSIVLVPVAATNRFGDLYTILAREDEIFYPDISVDDVEIVTEYSDAILRVGDCEETGQAFTIRNDMDLCNPYWDLSYSSLTYIDSLSCHLQ